jgi:competence protein ComEA
MFYFIKKYWKYILVFFCCVLLFIGTYIYNQKNEISTNNDKKMAVTKSVSKTNENDTSNKSQTVFVDVKGAVNAPGVYELEDTKRVIDAINLAGGLADNANTINLNLSKKVQDEMYIIVYTKNEIATYKKNNGSKTVSCASNECICPDSNNDACIKTSTSSSSSSTSSDNSTTEVTGKISINTATKEELMTLSGIGEAKANAIISYRQENGNFSNLEDIKNVSGIGDAVYEKIKNNITL